MAPNAYGRIQISRARDAELVAWNSDSKYSPDLQGQLDPSLDHQKLALLMHTKLKNNHSIF
jgi:hypothetical protein